MKADVWPYLTGEHHVRASGRGLSAVSAVQFKQTVLVKKGTRGVMRWDGYHHFIVNWDSEEARRSYFKRHELKAHLTDDQIKVLSVLDLLVDDE